MNKKVLLCLFTYNRPSFLLNAARSIDSFFPIGDRLIIDDGSSDPLVSQVIDRICATGNGKWKSYIRNRGADNLAYGGFYKNMSYALKYALSIGYDYCFFFEDDSQFVLDAKGFIENCEKVFDECQDAIQIQPLFLRRMASYHNSCEYIASANAYRTNRGFSTTAIWNLAHVRKLADEFHFFCDAGDDLPRNSAFWLKRGFRLYLAGEPNVAIIPWVQSYSHGSQPSSTHSNIDEVSKNYILKPLSEKELHWLEHRDHSIPAYQEYFSLSKENTERPIWHQKGQNLVRYYQLCSQIIEEENRLGKSPVPINKIPVWTKATSIPELASHLSWKPNSNVPKEWKKRVPKWLKNIKKQAILFRQFTLKSYFAYRELSQRLKKEQDSLALF